MRIFQKFKPETLSEWLDVATRKLSVPAEARVRSEIEAHFVEAVDEQIQNGSSRPVAQLLALEQLGDPKAAAKRFRKCHLTVREARFLAFSIKDSKSVITLLANYAYFIVFAILAFACSVSKLRPLYMVLAFLVMAVFPTVGFVLLRMHETKGNVRCMLFVRSMGGLLPDFVLYWCMLFAPTTDLALVLLLVCCCSIVSMTMPCLTIWRKLRRVSGDWTATSDLDTART